MATGIFNHPFIPSSLHPCRGARRGFKGTQENLSTLDARRIQPTGFPELQLWASRSSSNINHGCLFSCPKFNTPPAQYWLGAHPHREREKGEKIVLASDAYTPSCRARGCTSALLSRCGPWRHSRRPRRCSPCPSSAPTGRTGSDPPAAA